ncbi:unnamed protein product [marine sediment metagenome]|uniref:Uncharacterized protein n=1 Tax=marine sediment metagenome TaxID=412755 RepID=X1HUY4_9ZZZZ
MGRLKCDECGSANVVCYGENDEYTGEECEIMECEDCGYRTDI